MVPATGVLPESSPGMSQDLPMGESINNYFIKSFIFLNCQVLIMGCRVR
jgi:hypothetical protein